MAAIATSADGAYIFMALEDTSGFPVIVKCSRDDLATFTAAYDPGAGTAGNVASVPGNPDLMLLFGNFGTDVTVILYTISTATPADISPPGLGAKVVNTLAVNPSNAEEIMITVDTDQDFLFTQDQGATRETLNAALGFDATALHVRWPGGYEENIGYVAGTPAASQLLFSPNEGADFDDIAPPDLDNAGGIVGVEGVASA